MFNKNLSSVNALASPSNMREYALGMLSYPFWYMGHYCGDYVVVPPPPWHCTHGADMVW
jgi:hypothetical protein